MSEIASATVAEALRSRERQSGVEVLLDAAERLAPSLSARSAEIEAARRLPADIVEELRAAGFFRAYLPRRLGGFELSVPDQIRVIEALSAADSSVGWCVKIGMDSGYFAGLLPSDAVAAIFPDPDLIIAGHITISTAHGRLEQVEGGYLLNGRFPFASGCTHADVILTGVPLHVDGPAEPAVVEGLLPGTPDVRLTFAPASAFRIEDTWTTTGLCGTGSNHYSAENLFIPESHAATLGPPLFAGQDRLYRSLANLRTPIAGIALGIARRAVEEGKALVRKRQTGAPPHPLMESSFAKGVIAEAELAYRSARAFVMEAGDAAWDALEPEGSPLRAEADARMALALIGASRAACDITRSLFELSGGSGVYRGATLERLFRDAATLRQHAVFGRELLEDAGGILLGQAPRLLL